MNAVIKVLVIVLVVAIIVLFAGMTKRKNKKMRKERESVGEIENNGKKNKKPNIIHSAPKSSTD